MRNYNIMSAIAMKTLVFVYLYMYYVLTVAVLVLDEYGSLTPMLSEQQAKTEMEGSTWLDNKYVC